MNIQTRLNRRIIGSFLVILIISALNAAAPLSRTDKSPKKVGAEAILNHSQEWREAFAIARWDEYMVQLLAAKTGPEITVDVYFAFWCSDSLVHVPTFMRIIDRIREISGDQLTVNYYTVERKASKKVKYYVESMKVERAPTFIIFREGKELGRIVENPEKNLSEDFLAIVF